MNWDDLRFVLAVARSHTLSKAATVLGVRHTTVSRRLSACEQSLGARLFDRTPEGLFATVAGQELVDLAERMEGEVLATQSALMGRDAELRGPLRVSTLDYLFVLCRPAIEGFIARYPHVELSLNTAMAPLSLKRREADVAMRVTNKPPPGLVGRKLGQLTFAAFAAPCLAQRVGYSQDFAAYPWLAYDERLNESWLERWLAKNAPGARIALRADESGLVQRDLVRAGVGVFFLPLVEGRALGLFQVGEALSSSRVDYWLLTLPELRHASRVRAFLEHMVESVPSLLS